ncbi:MAG: hypothetical protein JXA42_18710 [Anaerolineales bacterium]|nr:hypothetical protein [Anaerolineales bacterium]
MKKDGLKKALQQVSDFIKTLEEIEELSGELNNGLFFSVRDEGTLYLNGDDVKWYRKGLKSLIDAIDSEMISPKSVEKLYQRTIFSVLDLADKRRDKSFDQRLKIALNDLEQSLNAPLKTYAVYYPIGGLSEEGLPVQVGNVTFCLFQNEQLEGFNEIVRAYSGDDPNQFRIREDTIDWINNSRIVGSPVGLVEVEAIDEEAAKVLAIKELSLTADIINFFSDLIPYQKGYLFLPGERERASVNVPIITKGNQSAYSFEYTLAGPLMPVSLKVLRENDQERKLGFQEVSDLLERKRNELESHLISAMQWAGKATAAIRKEEAFLWYAISLESLILMDNEIGELGYRLRTRAAHLLGKDLDGRKEISRKIREMYDIRSKIVHSGWFEVTDADLSLMRIFAKRSILTILNDEPFKSMKSVDALVGWFNDQVLK